MLQLMPVSFDYFKIYLQFFGAGRLERNDGKAKYAHLSLESSLLVM